MISNSLADFLARAGARLASHPEPAGIAARGDHDLTPEFQVQLDGRPIRDAAVLVPVVARAEPTVLLTQRTVHLPQHAGQIAFPGGKVDAQDASPLATALREAQEEVGLAPAQVRPVGYLDSYLSRTGFRIVPVVGLVDPAYRLSLNPHEVDEAFEVPLAFLMSPANHQRHSREGEGPVRTFHAMPYGERFIWGITAGIIHNLYERMYG
ncbi:MAG TPA: CoA pyrophosphatase [Xanthobacteraceae bacterium]|nr:CoA pyrophosphatase [Xanthobacteraceae bacterium]